MHKYEQKLMWTLMRNLLRHLPTRHPAVEDLFRKGDELFVLGRYAEAWLNARSVCDEQPEWVPNEFLPGLRGPLRWHDLAELELRALGPVRPSALRRRIDLIGRLFDIDQISLSMLEWLYLKEASALAIDLFRLVERLATRPALLLSIPSGHSVPAIERRLGPRGVLTQHGLLEQPRYLRIDQLPDLSQATYALLSQPLRSAADARRILLGQSLESELDWDDFEHLGDNRQLVAELIAGALRQGEAGVSVLLYGPPGTGKTELSKTLADRLGTEVYALGEVDDYGGTPSPTERLASIQMAQVLLREHGDALLLIDEAEDVLAGSDGLSGLFSFGRVRRQTETARVFLHRLLENSPAPMLWICNHIDGIDPAVLRRFSYVLEVQPPSKRSRRRVWLRSLVVRQANNLEFSWSVNVQGKARLAVNGRSPLQEPERCHGR
jgi:transitional endoplasmic reticulum ATPase